MAETMRLSVAADQVDTRYACGALKTILDPRGVNTACSSTFSLNTDDKCRTGDISGLFGGLSGLLQAQRTYYHTTMTLFGPETVVGRSVLVTRIDGRARVPLSCAPVAFVEAMDRLAAVFDHADVRGSVGVRRLPGAPDALVDVDLASPSGAAVTVADWFVAAECQAAAARRLDLLAAFGTQALPALKPLALATVPPPHELLAQQLVLNVGTAQTPRLVCAPLRVFSDQVINDKDSGDRAGLALVGSTQPHGRWQYRLDAASDWTDMPTDLSLTAALHLQTDTTARLRFVPEPGFMGADTCPECPVPRDKSCEPCPLDPRAGSITFVAWDGSNGLPHGIQTGVARADAERAAYSTSQKTVTVVIEPAFVNVTAPAGTTYNITFSVRDNVGNPAVDVVRQVTVIDTNPPHFELRGDTALTLEAGSDFIEPGFAAFDDRDGDVSFNVTVSQIAGTIPAPTSSTLNACSPPRPFPGNNVLDMQGPHGARFVLTYSASDAIGNIVPRTRTITLEDTQPPELFPATGTTLVEYSRTPVPLVTPPNRQAASCGGGDYLPAAAVSQVACVRAWDSLDGNVSCGASVTRVQALSSLASFATVPGARYGPFVPFDPSCLARQVTFANGTEVQEKRCGLGPPRDLNSVPVDVTQPPGTSYFLTYSAADRRGNVATAYRMVVIVDTLPPVLSVAGEPPEVPYGVVPNTSTILRGLTAFDERDGNTTDLLEVGDSTLNPVLAGPQNVTVRVKDRSGNQQLVNRTLRVLPQVVLRAAEEAALEMKVVLRGITASQFNVPSVHRAFKLGVVLALSDTLDYLTLDSVQGVVATPVAPLRRAENEPMLTQVEFDLLVACGDARDANEELSQAANSGALESELRAADAVVFRDVGMNPLTERVRVIDEGCPAVAESSSSGTTVPVGAIVAVPILVILLVVVLGIVWSRRQFNRRRKMQASINEVLDMSRFDSAVTVDNFMVPLDDEAEDVPVGYNESFYAETGLGSVIKCEPDQPLEEPEDIYSFNNDKLKKPRPVKVGDSAFRDRLGTSTSVDSLVLPATGGGGKRAPPPPPMDDEPRALAFRPSDEDVYETGDAVRPGFSAHDRGARSEELQDIYEASTDHALPPLPPPKAVEEAEDMYSYDNSKLPAVPAKAPAPIVVQEEEEEYGYNNTVLAPKPAPSTQGTLGFTETPEDFYDVGGAGLTANKPGFSSHDRTERSDALEELYMAGNDILPPVREPEPAPPAPPPKAVEESDDMYSYDNSKLPSVPAKAPAVLAQEEEEEYGYNNTALAPKPITTDNASGTFGFTETPEDFYDVGALGLGANKPGFSSHDRSERSDALEELYMAGNEVLPPVPVPVAPAPVPVPAPEPEPDMTLPGMLPMAETEEDIYDGGVVARAGFSAHDRSERSDLLEEMYMATNEASAGSARRLSSGSTAAPAPVAAVQDDDIYDIGDAPSKPGFSTHDSTERSEALEQLYETSGIHASSAAPATLKRQSSSSSSMGFAGLPARASSSGSTGSAAGAPLPPRPSPTRGAASPPLAPLTGAAPRRLSVDDADTSWMHGKLNRNEAEDRLRAAGLQDGMFLVRTKGSNYVVSLCKNKEFEHHIVAKDGTGLFTLNSKELSKPCPTITAVIRHLRRYRETLACLLVEGIPAPVYD